MLFSRVPFGVDPFSGASSLLGAICCNCQPGQPCCGCTTYDTLRRQWNLAVTGVTNSSCTSCSNYNGTYALMWAGHAGDPASCLWNDWRPSLPGCHFTLASGYDTVCTRNDTWRLTYEPIGTTAGTYHLRPNIDPNWDRPEYVLDAASWSCTGTNVMVRGATGTAEACAFPVSVTLTPATSPMPDCGLCYPPYDAVANAWTVQVSGVVDGACGCSDFNRNIPLRRYPDQGDPCLSGSNACNYAGTVVLEGSCAGSTVCVSIQLAFDFGIAYLNMFVLGGSVNEQYYQRMGSFNPVGANVFSKIPAVASSVCGGLPGAGCSNFPTALTVAPV